MALRNLEEQVLYLTNELEKIKQSLGNALPDPIPGPKGEPGDKGNKGDTGNQGYGIVGYGTQLPSSGRDGDWFILKTSTMTGIDYVMYRCVSQHWVAQFSMRGPAGPVSNGLEVVANPETPSSETLSKIKIEGVTYEVLPDEQRAWLQELYDNGFSWDSVHNCYKLDNKLFIYNGAEVNDSDLEIASNGANIKLKSGLNQIVDNDNDPIVICENLNDANGNPRFVEGNLTTENTSGITYSYAKWSLSGSHLMVVVCGSVSNGTTVSNVYMASVTLPDYIKNKIYPVWANEFIEMKGFSFIDDSWNEQGATASIGISGSSLYVYLLGSTTMASNKKFRLQFDLLIDME